MALATEDYLELSRLLEENPELRADLRRLVLTQDLLDLPSIVRDLAEAQRRSEERLGAVEERLGGVEERVGRMEEAITALAEAQRRSEERLGAVEERLGGVEERVGRMEEAITALAEAQRRSEERLATLEATTAQLVESQRQTTLAVARLDKQVSSMRGTMLEWRYRERAVSYFGSFLRRPFPVGLQEFDDALEATVSEEEVRDLFRVDLVVRGVPRGRPVATEVLLAVEVSAVVDSSDVERAVRRAGILRKLGLAVVPAVAGEAVTEGAEDQAAERHVLVLEDGRHSYWHAALDHWTAVP